jgi:hypothetical protein
MFIEIDFGRNDGTIPSGISTMNAAPTWIIARLDDDFNWWLDRTSDESGTATHNRGLLDPRQVIQLIEALDTFRTYGYRRDQLANAFQLYCLESEIADGTIRLAPTNEDLFSSGELFALPNLGEDGDGPYFTLLDFVTQARVRQLNKTHHYARNCTDQDLTEELDAVDASRYFDADQIHVFDEITEILEWSPAEWDDSSFS